MNNLLTIRRISIAFSPLKSIINLCLLFSCYLMFVCFKPINKVQFIVVKNPSSFKRHNEIITIKKIDLNEIKTDLFPIIKKKNKILVSQTIDTNDDCVWDELLVEINIAANATDTLQLSWINKDEYPAFKKYTNVRLSLRSNTNIPSAEINTTQRVRGFSQNIAKPFYQMEGPGIENDKVAFRAFFDYRNSFDIYGKIVDTPVLEHVGVGSSWHELQPWGMDIFHTGNSLGAGGLAVEENNKIYRLGDADTSIFKTLYEGALQAAFKLGFKNWDVGKGKKDGSELITISKGNFYYKNDISVELNKSQSLIAGMSNFGIDHVVFKKHNSSFSSISTYGNQAEGTNTKLGVAIMFPATYYLANKTADSASIIANTSYVLLKPTNKKSIYFFACWEKTDNCFSTQKGFENYLQKTADKFANPILITIIK